MTSTKSQSTPATNSPVAEPTNAATTTTPNERWPGRRSFPRRARMSENLTGQIGAGAGRRCDGIRSAPGDPRQLPPQLDHRPVALDGDGDGRSAVPHRQVDVRRPAVH